MTDYGRFWSMTAFKEKCAVKMPQFNRWSLEQCVAVARHLDLITEETRNFCWSARRYRNLIHPGARARRMRALRPSLSNQPPAAQGRKDAGEVRLWRSLGN